MIDQIEVETAGRGLLEITGAVSSVVRAAGLEEGLCTVMVRHTSASLTIQENASPAARRDLERFLDRLVPDGGDGRYEHHEEGPDDMPSHIKAALTSTTLSIPIVAGRLALGTWQGVFLWEHRTRGSKRRCVIHCGR